MFTRLTSLYHTKSAIFLVFKVPGPFEIWLHREHLKYDLQTVQILNGSRFWMVPISDPHCKPGKSSFKDYTVPLWYYTNSWKQSKHHGVMDKSYDLRPVYYYYDALGPGFESASGRFYSFRKQFQIWEKIRSRFEMNEAKPRKSKSKVEAASSNLVGHIFKLWIRPWHFGNE